MMAPVYAASTNDGSETISAQFYALATTVSTFIPYLGCAVVSASPLLSSSRMVWIVFSAPLVTSSEKAAATFYAISTLTPKWFIRARAMNKTVSKCYSVKDSLATVPPDDAVAASVAVSGVNQSVGAFGFVFDPPCSLLSASVPSYADPAPSRVVLSPARDPLYAV